MRVKAENRRGAAPLWHQGHRGGAALGGLRGPDCQGGEARRPAFRGRPAPRAHRQPQDGAGDWRHDPARGAQAGRPGHTMRGSATSSTIGATELPNHRLLSNALVIEMKRDMSVVLYILVLIAVVVSVDLLFFKNRFWERNG